MGRNDETLLEATGVGRDVNRHHYTSAEVEAALADPDVRRLLALVELRRTHPAFDGEWWLAPVDTDRPERIAMGWRAEGGHEVTLHLDAASRRAELTVDGARRAV